MLVGYEFLYMWSPKISACAERARACMCVCGNGKGQRCRGMRLWRVSFCTPLSVARLARKQAGTAGARHRPAWV